MATQSSVINRMRTGDIRSIPLSFWALLALAAFAAWVYTRAAGGRLLEPDNVAPLYLGTAPFLFAAAVALAAPADRRYFWGAVAMGANQLWLLALFLEPAFGEPGLYGVLVQAVRPVVWAVTLAGLLLIGVAVGGIRSRVAWGVVAISVLVFVVSAALQWIDYASVPDDLLITIVSPEAMLVGLLGQTVTIGWAYVLGAALDNSRRFLALGAGLMLALAVYALVRLLLLPATPGTDFAMLNMISLALAVAAWTTLIVAAITEFGPRRRAPVEADTEANLDAEALA